MRKILESISQWLPCPLAIWNLLFLMAFLLNLVKIRRVALQIRPIVAVICRVALQIRPIVAVIR